MTHLRKLAEISERNLPLTCTPNSSAVWCRRGVRSYPLPISKPPLATARNRTTARRAIPLAAKLAFERHGDPNRGVFAGASRQRQKTSSC